jgi:Restriction endonuclease
MGMPKITRTMGPIHFEDLDSHRFEDLVRELMYDFKDWQSIEATGRSGSDDGFDIRAYEKNYLIQEPESDEDSENISHPMEGNLWMIQCKRKQTMGPTDVSKIIQEGVSKEDPPYGYILVASANFSKKSYDVFRKELRGRGVMEFYLWGKAELEDLLHQPKYDRILFTFFGVSLVTAKRSKITSQRAFINTKNKLTKLLGDNPEFQDILLRDLQDEFYPDNEKYPDFNEHPRWKVFQSAAYNVKGFWVNLSCHIAYFDVLTGEWDYFPDFDLDSVYLDGDTQKERETKMNRRRTLDQFLKQFPSCRTTHLSVLGHISYEDIALIDEKGDMLYKFLHLYIDRGLRKSFIRRKTLIIKGLRGKHQVDRPPFIRKKIFPEIFSNTPRSEWHRDLKITVSPATFEHIIKKYFRTLFCRTDRYEILKPNDIAEIISSEPDESECMIRLNAKYPQTWGNYKEANLENYEKIKIIEEQIGKNVPEQEMLFIYEFDVLNSEDVAALNIN